MTCGLVRYYKLAKSDSVGKCKPKPIVEDWLKKNEQNQKKKSIIDSTST